MDAVGNGINAAVPLVGSVVQSLSGGSDNISIQGRLDKQDAADLHTLIRFMEVIDMDPIKWSRVNEKKLRRILGRRVRCTMDTAYAMESEKEMENPFRYCAIGQDTVVYLNALPQVGKTTLILFAIWRGGVQHDMSSIMFTLARDGESDRLASATYKFNNFVTTCAEVLGVDLRCVPRLRLYDSKVKGDDIRFAEALKRGLAREIPFYTAMGNSNGVKRVRAVIEGHMSMNVGRDAPDFVNSVGQINNSGRMNAMIVVDEVDTFIQPKRTVTNRRTGEREEVNGALDAATKEEFILNKEIHVPHDPSRRRPPPTFDPVEANGLFETCTAVMLVTATVQAFTMIKSPLAERSTKHVIFPRPSNNYWSPLPVTGWGCKVVENRQVDSPTDMLDHIATCEDPRHSMVTMTSKLNGTRVKAMQDEMALGAVQRQPGVAGLVWNGDGVKVYTTDNTWKGHFLSSDSFDVARVTETITCFSSKKSNKKRQEWYDSMGPVDDETNKPRGGVMRNHVNSYPGLMDLMYEMHDEHGTPLPHTILYSLNMASRGTPVKGWSHRGVLTDMYFDTGPRGHDEYIIQLVGRHFGIDDRTQEQGKIIWASRDRLDRFYRAVIAAPFYAELLKKGAPFPELFERAERRVYEATGVSGVFVDRDQVLTKPSSGITRGGIEKGTAAAARKFKRACLSTRTRVERVETESMFEHVPIVRHVPVAPVASSDPTPDPVAPVASPDPTPEQAWDKQKDVISRGMKSVVESNGGSASRSVMANNIEGEFHFDNSNGFTMEVFVDTICVTQDALDMSGLEFRDGVFSVKNKSTRSKHGPITNLAEVVSGFIKSKLVARGGEALRCEIIRDILSENVMGPQCWKGWADVEDTNVFLRGYFNRLQLPRKSGTAGSVLESIGIRCDHAGESNKNVLRYTMV